MWRVMLKHHIGANFRNISCFWMYDIQARSIQIQLLFNLTQTQTDACLGWRGRLLDWAKLSRAVFRTEMAMFLYDIVRTNNNTSACSHIISHSAMSKKLDVKNNYFAIGLGEWLMHSNIFVIFFYRILLLLWRSFVDSIMPETDR